MRGDKRDAVQLGFILIAALLLLYMLANLSLISMAGSIYSTKLNQGFIIRNQIYDRTLSVLSEAKIELDKTYSNTKPSLLASKLASIYSPYTQFNSGGRSTTYLAPWRKAVEKPKQWSNANFSQMVNDVNKQLLGSYLLEKISSAKTKYSIYRITASSIDAAKQVRVTLQGILQYSPNSTHGIWLSILEIENG